jgi:predicted ATPase/GAF domain-containing protein/HPt (histidine-containing phosphotransfer) domain-containing protein
VDDVTLNYELNRNETATDSGRVRAGWRRADGKKVMIKVPRGDYPGAAELALIRHEHSLIRELADAPVAAVLDLVRIGNGIGMVLEDLGRRSFDRVLVDEPFELGRWLDLAIGAAAALRAVHARGVLHKDVKPHHFFCLPDGRVALIDFGIAVKASHEDQKPGSLDSLEGTLTYISPEQTGRMNRTLDRRSDLYSLGATLYHLLTGSPPFVAVDPLELVHCHIARFPTAPGDLRPGSPAVISDIVLRLLAKVAEDRYQTAAGLEADLRRCREQFARSKRLEAFALGKDDRNDELVIPQKLYGRAAASASLLASFERATLGAPELCLIGGGSGLGKTMLVQELHRQLVRGGHFASGKFDQWRRSAPYSGLAEACSELVRAQLATPPEKLADWAERLRDALGMNGQLLIDIIPDIELVIGKQPAALPLGPNESIHRFETTFQRFMATCASPQSPLVLFLDDLQWADPASLRLMRKILTNPEQRCLLLIGNYRDNEVGPLHPLTHFMDGLGELVVITRIALEPLREEHVAELLLDTLHGSVGPIEPLAQLLVRKTGGNPFFVGQLLHEMKRQQLLAFDSESRSWTWDVSSIDAVTVTDNVVELLIQKLSRLEPRTQAILRFAACIGHRFDSMQLATICETTPTEIAQGTRQALEQGFLVPLDKNYRLLAHRHDDESAARATDAGLRVGYRFAHDRIQQAAYEAIAEDERAPLHLRMGRLLLANSPEGQAQEHEEALFEIVRHLNLGRACSIDPDERLRIASLNLLAARRAKNAAATATALEHAALALELLGPSPWQAEHELAYAAQLILAECAYLMGNSAATLAAVAAIEEHARTLLERVAGRNLKTLLSTNEGRPPEATAISLETIRLLGVDMPDQMDRAALGQAIGAEFGAYQAALAGRSIESLLELAPMTDPEKLALVAAFAQVIPAAYQWNPDLMVLVVLKAVQLPLAHGTAPASSFLYSCYGTVHSIVTQDYETAYRFGQLALRLSERPEQAPARGAVRFVLGAFLSPWQRPLPESLEHFRIGARAASEGGDSMHAAYCLGLGLMWRFYGGESLESLAADVPGYTAVMGSLGDTVNLGFVVLVRQTLACLQGKTQVFGRLDDDTFSEAAFRSNSAETVAATLGTHQLMLRYLAGFAAEALEAADSSPPQPTLYYNAEYVFYRALSLAALARDAEPERRPVLLERLRADVELYARWAAGCRHNFAHRHSLLSAELASLEGNVERAMACYDEAISGGTEHGFMHHVAIASELAGRFHHTARRTKIARLFLSEARYHYARWGAVGKVRQLEQAYPDLELTFATHEPAQTAQHAATRLRDGTTTSHAGEGNLDLMSAMRAAHAMASELELDRLIERLLTILVENAGARRGHLVLPEAGGLFVVASITVDPDRIELGAQQALTECRTLPASIVQYVARSKAAVVLDDATADHRYSRDPYLSAGSTRSLVCLPMLHQGELSAILYLENAAAAGVFHAARLERLVFLASHAAVALENAKLYGQVQSARRKLEEANDLLEHKVRERTAELSGRNADMRRVLDNVMQGLITLDLDGKIAAECSLAAERWFGPFDDGTPFADHMGRFDAGFADPFAIAFESFKDGFLGDELALDQLPKSLSHAGRQYALGYSPIRSVEQNTGLLVVISDATEALAFAREEAAQKELLALCQRLTQDRSGVLGFFEDGHHILTQLQAPGAGGDELKRLLHTLKGNAGLFGLSVLAARCHAAEDAVIRSSECGEALLAVRERWQVLVQTLDSLLGKAGRDRLEIPRADLNQLLARLDAGASAADAAIELRRWQLESTQKPLGRLGEHAQMLAERLGKGEVRVSIEDGGVFVDAERSQPLWSVLVHVIRNAADHGFESRMERAARGKPAANQLWLEASLAGDLLRIRIRDDGRGIDWERVRGLAMSRGLPSSSLGDLVRALLAPDVSTRSEVTDTSGRGMGMSAVDRDVRALGGSLSLESEPGRGCSWTIDVPRARVGAFGWRSEDELRARHADGSKRATSPA